LSEAAVPTQQIDVSDGRWHAIHKLLAADKRE
jgi:hypothetical protein